MFHQPLRHEYLINAFPLLAKLKPLKNLHV